MARISFTAFVNAPPAEVHRASADPRLLPEILPEVIRCEFVGETRDGPGTRYVATTVVDEREEPILFEVLEAHPSRLLRTVNQAGGLVFDGTTRFEPDGNGTSLAFEVDVRATGLLMRLLLLFMKASIREGMVEGLNHLRAYCEARDGSRGPTRAGAD